MIPSGHSPIAFANAAWEADTDLEADAYQVGTSRPFSWSLPVHEVAKMERLEQGGTLALSTMVEHCLNRVAELDDDMPGFEFNAAFKARRRRVQPNDEEVAAMIAEVPLCLLSGRERLQALALRQHGVLASEATANDFDPEASLEKLIIATMYALNAARGDTRNTWAQGLAKLARWETEVSSDRDAEARASGGRALREVVKNRIQGCLHLEGQGLTGQLARQFSLPPPGLLAELERDEFLGVAILNQARPLDLDTFHDAMNVLDMRSWDVHLNDDRDWSLSLIPDRAECVSLWGDSNRCGRFAVALASAPGRDIETVWIYPTEPAAERDLPDAPSGWRFDPSPGQWTLSRIESPEFRHAVCVLADWGANNPRTLWKAIDACDDGQLLVAFLAESGRQLAGVAPLYADIVRQEMTTRSASLLQMLAAEPALLSELSHDLAGPWTCIDAKRKTLASMEQMLRAGSDPGALLRMSLHHLADRYASMHDAGTENIEHSLALQALLDHRLAQITGTSFIRIGVPYFTWYSGMNRSALGREPVLADWSDNQRNEVEQILGDEVRAGFPMLREFMQSKSGAACRAVEHLQLDPSFQAAQAEWQRLFLDAEERADEDPSDVDAAQRYGEIQQQMPLALDKLSFALMDEWLDPLRMAYPASPTS